LEATTDSRLFSKENIEVDVHQTETAQHGGEFGQDTNPPLMTSEDGGRAHEKRVAGVQTIKSIKHPLPGILCGKRHTSKGLEKKGGAWRKCKNTTEEVVKRPKTPKNWRWGAGDRADERGRQAGRGGISGKPGWEGI